MNKGYVYFLTNYKRSAPYIGVTSNLSRRIWEHKEGKGSEFTARYKLTILVYAEGLDSITDAITREKQLKNRHKDRKWNLVKQHNPKLKDCYETMRT
ncbi:MAG: GIY-YIG nuclease family protein [Balneola sp.]|nr:MAG: GIY-YIG nuclease family protein [Balneola sp.]